MHLIEFFIESHWEIQRPKLTFFLNNKELTVGHYVLHNKLNNSTERLIYKFITSDINDINKNNNIIVNLSEKANDLVTNSCDHWVEVKNISIDGIYADWLLYANTKFVHAMSQDWVNDMKKQNIEILDEYRPGTEMRLNGNMFFNFEFPFWLYKTKEIEKR